MTDEAGMLTVEELEDIRDLLETGMQDEAEDRLVQLAGRLKQNSVYSQVGELTRDLHNALTDFVDDDRLRVIANVEMPDASERLKYIISMTSDAATKTLDAVDNCEPMLHTLMETIDNLLPAWKELMNGKIDRYTFVALCHKVDNLIEKTQNSANDLSAQLNAIMMAQDYQDLTGQMIQKVIKLVTEVEDRLVGFLVSFGKPQDDEEQKGIHQGGVEVEGPLMEQEKQAPAVAASQDDVDDLLASLGF
ncbi:MAG: protein phosphatase CheZ [Succinivibrio sp.]|nr:protein phosphatase CheZ [Succinivibrio sp.]